jgi:hypothetical protein
MARLIPGVRPKSSALMMRREDIEMRRKHAGGGRAGGALARVYRMRASRWVDGGLLRRRLCFGQPGEAGAGAECLRRKDERWQS